MEKELTHEKMHELGIEHTFTSADQSSPKQNVQDHRSYGSRENNGGKRQGLQRGTDTVSGSQVCDRRCEPGHFKRPH